MTAAKLQQAILHDRVSHAYLLCGEAGRMKESLASLFAMTLLCESPKTDRAAGTIEPCCVCASCRKAMAGSHPDILTVRHEKPTVLSVGEIREQLCDTADVKPYEGDRKVYIVPDADRMNPQAQNALLKTLEEPPAYTVILLLAENEETLLPTIRSRCVILPVRNLSITELVSSDTAGTVVNFLSGICSMQLRQAVEAARRFSEDKAALLQLFDIFRAWYRDVLYFKATKEVDGLIFRDQTARISQAAKESGYEGLEEILQAIDRAEARVIANVNRETVLELLFMTMMEN